MTSFPWHMCRFQLGTIPGYDLLTILFTPPPPPPPKSHAGIKMCTILCLSYRTIHKKELRVMLAITDQ